MDRQAEIIYLKNIRDLEMARKFVERKIANAEYTISHAYDKCRPEYKEQKDIAAGEIISILFTTVMTCCMVLLNFYYGEIKYYSGVIFFLLFINMGIMAITRKDNGLIVFSGVLCVLHSIVIMYRFIVMDPQVPLGLPLVFYFLWLVFISFSGILPPIMTMLSQNKKIALENGQEQQRVAKAKQMADIAYNKALSNAKYYKGELQKIKQLLKNGYSLNLIPNQYRYKLAAIQYIYDWMSSCQDTMSDTLFHTHIEDGIQRIEAKLDTIISQNMEIIAQTRSMESTLRRTEINDLKKLDTLRRIESNSANAAMYAQIGSQYAEVSAFFGVADYFKRN